MSMRLAIVSTLAAVSIAQASPARSENWPQFRGPTGLGYTEETLGTHHRRQADEETCFEAGARRDRRDSRLLQFNRPGRGVLRLHG